MSEQQKIKITVQVLDPLKEIENSMFVWQEKLCIDMEASELEVTEIIAGVFSTISDVKES